MNNRRNKVLAGLLCGVFCLCACGGGETGGVPDSLSRAGVFEMSYEADGETFRLVCEMEKGDDFLTRGGTLRYLAPDTVAGLTVRRQAGETTVTQGGVRLCTEGAEGRLRPFFALCLGGTVRQGGRRTGGVTEAVFLHPDGTEETLFWSDGDARPRTIRLTWPGGEMTLTLTEAAW